MVVLVRKTLQFHRTRCFFAFFTDLYVKAKPMTVLLLVTSGDDLDSTCVRRLTVTTTEDATYGY